MFTKTKARPRSIVQVGKRPAVRMDDIGFMDSRLRWRAGLTEIHAEDLPGNFQP